MSSKKNQMKSGYLYRDEAAMKSYCIFKKFDLGHQVFNDIGYSSDKKLFGAICDKNTFYVFNINGENIHKNIVDRNIESSLFSFLNKSSCAVFNNDSRVNNDAIMFDYNEEKIVRTFNHKSKITALVTTNNLLITSTETFNTCEHGNYRNIYMYDLRMEEAALSDNIKHTSVYNVMIDKKVDNIGLGLHPNCQCLAVTHSLFLSLYDIRNINLNKPFGRKDFNNYQTKPYFGYTGRNLMIHSRKYAHTVKLIDLSYERSFPLRDILPSNNIGVFHDGFSFSSDERYSLFSTSDSNIAIFDTVKAKPVTVLAGAESPISKIVVSDSYYTFLTGGKELLLWDIDEESFETLAGKQD